VQPNIFPILRYDDAPRAIEFLARAFGFEVASDHRGPDGRVVHADLRLGSSVVGLSSTGTSPANSPWATVRQGIYIVLSDPDAVYARARSAGADVALPIADQSHGSRDFTLRDPEGHLWAFGTYAMERGSGRPTIVPEVLYEDVETALGWMETSIGFTRGLVVPGDSGGVKHAEMHLGDGVMFVGQTPASEMFRGLTHFVNLHVADPDAHHARAKAAGARIVMEPQLSPFNARFYAAQDLGGFVWWVSDYAGAAGAAHNRSAV
jgi:uncharacterized glyoxalase superfamily protein PhnB